MSLCPAFHCSRCNISHADECPPPKKDIVDLWREAIAESTASLVLPVFSAVIVNGYSPTVGSKWFMETKINAPDPWGRGGNVAYEVIALGAMSASVRRAGIGFTILYLYDHWYADGFDDGNGIRMRFVPAPP